MPQLRDLAKAVGVESGVLLAAIILVSLLVTFCLFGATIVTLTITVLFPAFKSIQALESDGTQDDKEWLTYWIIFGIFSLIDDFFGCILEFIPYYYWIKLAFFIYLLAPQTQGAMFIYNNIVKGFLEKNKASIQGLIDDVKGSVNEAASEAKKTAINELQNP